MNSQMRRRKVTNQMRKTSLQSA